MGWLTGSSPLPSSPISGAMMIGAFALSLATSAALAGPGAGLAYVVGLAFGFVSRKAFERPPRLESHS